MDYGLSQAQTDLVHCVESVVQEAGGVERAVAVATQRDFDDGLETALRAAITVGGLSLLDRVLIADRLAEMGTATTFGLSAVVLGRDDLPPGPLTVVHADRSGLGRYAHVASTAVVLSGGAARLCALDPADVTEVTSGSGYPYGRVPPDALVAGEPLDDPAAAARWSLAVATEIGGTAAAAVARTATHLRTRHQFGHPLSTFQALRHRLAGAAVSAEATRWLAREAAYGGDDRGVQLAALYARDCAAELSPDLVQMWGARGFAHEFGFSGFAMRLQGLRLELGSAGRVARLVDAAPWPAVS